MACRGFVLGLGLVAALGAFVNNIAAEEPAVRRENIEWTNIWIPDATKTDLPRVLLIGDSICNAYHPMVENELRGKAYVAKVATSSAVQDPVLADQIRLLLKNYPFAIVHFNNGLHGFDYTEGEYQRDFPKLLEVIKQNAPNAKLIWANSTPMRKSENLQQFHETNERVKARNKIVAGLAAQHNIPVNDLYSVVESHPEYWSNDGVHFKPEGQAVEAKQVADAIRKELNKQP
jgi:lysophospholipase L1-like esterase